MMRVALLGYGRFGSAFAEILAANGAEVTAFDTNPGSVPADLRAPDLPTLVRGVTHVVVAVPVSTMLRTLHRIAPHLTGAELVMDVGSVKVGPATALGATLGARIPWVATHPLFGPVSLARAERPMRVVVCPNDQHPDAVARARAFYEALGCEVIELSPEDHDKSMARTHALAFFIAKGMLDIDKEPVPFAPPSYQGIARTVEAVRADAGHLFRTISQDNPYAAGARAQLLEALSAIDRALTPDEADTDVRTRDSRVLAIPDLDARSPELQKTRSHIDAIDRELIELLSRRAALAERAAAVKSSIGHGVTDAAREAEVLETRRRWGEELGLDPDSIDELFRSVLRFSRRHQRRAK